MRDSYDGATFDSLAVSDARELRHRLWRGQVAVLFGWLEELRIAFVNDLAPRDQGSGEDMLAWEWGELAMRMRRTNSRDAANFAENCRKLRNKLAHVDPVGWDDIATVIGQARRIGLRA